MCTYRVKITQPANTPLWVCVLPVRKNMLYHKLGAPIGISWRKREALSNRDRSRITIHRCRRGKDHIPNPCLLHRRQQNERARDIVIVILQRLINRLTHRLQTGEV